VQVKCRTLYANLLYLSIFYKHHFNNKTAFLLLASPYEKTKRIRWSQKEQDIALYAFAEYMKSSKLPSIKTIQEIKRKYTVLAQCTSPQIKTWLHNKQKALRQQCEYY